MATNNPSAWRYTMVVDVSSESGRQLLRQLIDSAITFGMSFRATRIAPASGFVTFVACVAVSEQDAIRDLGLGNGN